jgi:putative Holliday junction resolvase
MRSQVLGIDYGTRKVGLAIADLSVHVVTPLCVLEGSNAQFIHEIGELVRLQGVSQVVVGMPLKADGTSSSSTDAAQTFILQLRDAIPVPVIAQDERFTTKAAQAQMRQAGKSSKKTDDDALAAAQILQSYLDRLATGSFV